MNQELADLQAAMVAMQAQLVLEVQLVEQEELELLVVLAQLEVQELLAES